MNPHRRQSAAPLEIFRSLTGNWHLISSLTGREIVSRYRGTILGLFWSFFHPVLMLMVYTFVFSVVFQARWTSGSESKTEFALVLFAGLTVYNLFAECINRSPGLILSNVNYVKKVIFPLEILPLVALGSAAFHFLISLLVWSVFYVILFGVPHIQILLLPLVILPLAMMTLGFSWFFASLGVYLRDISQVVNVATMALMFLSPIFFPISILPEEYQALLEISPLTFIIEQARDVMIWGKGIAWGTWSAWTLASGLVMWLGFAWFQKTRHGFADVL